MANEKIIPTITYDVEPNAQCEWAEQLTEFNNSTHSVMYMDFGEHHNQAEVAAREMRKYISSNSTLKRTIAYVSKRLGIVTVQKLASAVSSSSKDELPEY